MGKAEEKNPEPENGEKTGKDKEKILMVVIELARILVLQILPQFALSQIYVYLLRRLLVEIGIDTFNINLALLAILFLIPIINPLQRLRLRPSEDERKLVTGIVYDM